MSQYPDLINHLIYADLAFLIKIRKYSKSVPWSLCRLDAFCSELSDVVDQQFTTDLRSAALWNFDMKMTDMVCNYKFYVEFM